MIVIQSISSTCFLHTRLSALLDLISSRRLHNEIAQARRRCERSLGLRIDASEVGVLHCEAGREHGVVIFVIIRFNVIIIIERSIIN